MEEFNENDNEIEQLFISLAHEEEFVKTKLQEIDQAR